VSLSARSELPKLDLRTGETLIALSSDDSLRQTLSAVAPEHAISFVTSEADLSARLLAEPAGVAILDTAAIKSHVADLALRLRVQFPDLVLIVAGGPEDQALLSAHVTQGTIYRFLHKPVSAQRVKLFVDAAWRRHDVEHAATGNFAALQLQSASARRATTRRLRTGALALGIGALGVLIWAGLKTPQTGAGKRAATHVASTQGAASALRANAALQTARLLARADAALAQGALIAPPAENAADLYHQVLQSDPTNPRARAGLAQVLERLLTAAEQALLAERTDDAERLTSAARAIEPGNVRVEFLLAEIQKERARAAQTHPAAAARAPDQVALDARVNNLLRQAQARQRSDALLEPPESSAKFFIDSALALEPDNPAVRKAQHDLTRRLLELARAAAQSGNVAQGERWMQAAAAEGASADEIASLQRELANTRIASKAIAMAKLSDLFNQRLTQGRLIDPPTDSAKYYLAQLEAADAAHPSTVLAREALSAQLLIEARNATQRNDFAAAQDWVNQARGAGASAAELAAVERSITSARTASAAAPTIVPEGSLQRVRYIPPEYPELEEERGRGGVVVMEYSVRPDGSVSDIVVTEAQPPGVFDSAALRAVRRWRYRPVMHDGHAIEQRVRLRLVFAPQ
jgi:TonB family protein